MLLGPLGLASHELDFRVQTSGVPGTFRDRDSSEEVEILWPILIVGPGLKDLLAGSFHDLRLFDVQARLLPGSPVVAF